MKNKLRRRVLLAIFFIGLALRLALAWMPGTEDMYGGKMWGALALRAGMVNVYALDDQGWLNVIFYRLHGIRAPIRVVHATDLGPLGPVGGFAVYPPVNILVSEASVALCKVLQRGHLQAGALLNTCMNLLPILFALGISLAVWRVAKTELGAVPLGAIATFWLNPFLILASPVLGYTDAIFSFFGLMVLICCFYRRFSWAMFFLSLACLTKPQAVVIIPVVAMAAYAEGNWRALWRYGLRLAFFTLVILLPYVVAGRVIGAFVGVFQNVINPALSAQQMNAWWLIGGVIAAAHGGADAIFPAVISLVSRNDFEKYVGLHPSWIALPAFFTFTGINLYLLLKQLRQGNRWAIFWAGALQIFGFTMLMMYVHEHHLYSFFVYALPLLALGHRDMTRFYWVLSFLFGLNLFLFEGLGEGYLDASYRLRTQWGFDLSIFGALALILAFLNLLRSRGWMYRKLERPGQTDTSPAQ